MRCAPELNGVAYEGNPVEHPTAWRPVGWEAILALLLLIAVVGGTLLNKDFLTTDNWANLLANFVEIALMALPLSLIVITGEIDLSVASMLGLSSSLLGLLWDAKVAVALAIVVCLLVGALCGALNGFLIVRFHLPSLAVTIGTLALLRGFAYILLGDKAVADFPPEYIAFGIGVVPTHSYLRRSRCSSFSRSCFGSCFITPPWAAVFTRSVGTKQRRFFRESILAG